MQTAMSRSPSASKVGGLGAGHATNTLHQHDHLEFEVAVVLEKHHPPHLTVGWAQEPDVRDQEVPVRVTVDVGSVHPDRLDQPLAQLHGIVQSAEPHDSSGQRLGGEYLEAAVPVQVVHPYVRRRVGPAIRQQHGVPAPHTHVGGRLTAGGDESHGRRRGWNGDGSGSRNRHAGWLGPPQPVSLFQHPIPAPTMMRASTTTAACRVRT